MKKLKKTNKENESLRKEVEELSKAAQLSPKFDVGKKQYYETIKDAIVRSQRPKTVPLQNFPSQDDLPDRVAQVILQRKNLETELNNKKIDSMPATSLKTLMKKIRAEVSKEGGVGAWFQMVLPEGSQIPEGYIDQAFRVSWPARVAMI